MKLKNTAAALFVLGAAGLAPSALAAVTLDARLAAGAYEIDDGFDTIEFDSTGADMRVAFDATPNLFLRGEILAVSADEATLQGLGTADVQVDTTIFRAGLGYQGQVSSFKGYGALEYFSLDLEVEGDGERESGVLLAGGLKDAGEGKFLWNVEVGLLSLSGSDGAVFEFAVGYRVTPSFAITLGAQSYALEDDSGVELSLPTGMLGAQVRF